MKRFLGFSIGVFVSIMLMMLITVNFSESAEKAAEKALEASSESAGKAHNTEGIKHYDKGHWEKAQNHFGEAVEADKNLAEAHYNLALSLHNQGKHGDALIHFKHALKLGSNNPAIANSQILKNHLK